MSRGESITVSVHGLEEVSANFLAMPAQIETAKQRALRRTVSWIGNRSRREIGQALDVAATGLRKRVTPRFFKHSAEVFFGLGPLPAHLSGKASQTQAGVSVRGRQYPGAFVSSIYTAEEKVWIRLHSKHYDSDVYPYTPRKMNGAIGSGQRGRFPVVLARIPMDTPAVRGIIKDQADQALPRLKEVFAAELNYETNVKGGA